MYEGRGEGEYLCCCCCRCRCCRRSCSALAARHSSELLRAMPQVSARRCPPAAPPSRSPSRGCSTTRCAASTAPHTPSASPFPTLPSPSAAPCCQPARAWLRLWKRNEWLSSCLSCVLSVDSWVAGGWREQGDGDDSVRGDGRAARLPLLGRARAQGHLRLHPHRPRAPPNHRRAHTQPTRGCHPYRCRSHMTCWLLTAGCGGRRA